jgi:hypothetical protein
MDHGGGEVENRSPVLVFHWRRIFYIFWWLETENRNGVPYRCSVRVSLRLSTTDSQKRKMGLHCSSPKRLQWSTDPHSLFSVVPPTQHRNEARLLSLSCVSPPSSLPPFLLCQCPPCSSPQRRSPLFSNEATERGTEGRRGEAAWSTGTPPPSFGARGRRPKAARSTEELLLLQVVALAFLLEYATTKLQSVGKEASGGAGHGGSIAVRGVEYLLPV